MRTVLLAGATGTLGRELIPALSKKGYQVKVIAREQSKKHLSTLSDDIHEIITAEVTQPNTLQGICDNVDIVISTLGITRQRDKLTYQQVDFKANVNLMREAERAGAKKFVYISVIDADSIQNVPVITAKRQFELALMNCRINWLIFRPSGFFTDTLEVFKMAQAGRVHLFGEGENVITPIDVGDLAHIIVDEMSQKTNIARTVGGPEDLTWNELATLCFDVLQKRPRIYHWPTWILTMLLAITKRVAPYAYGPMNFMGHVLTHNSTAPKLGKRTLRDFLEKTLEGVKTEK